MELFDTDPYTDPYIRIRISPLLRSLGVLFELFDTDEIGVINARILLWLGRAPNPNPNPNRNPRKLLLLGRARRALGFTKDMWSVESTERLTP